MTKLEKELSESIRRTLVVFNMGSIDAFAVPAAAEVAKRYIEKAINDFQGCGCCQPYQGTESEWLKENGIE